MTLRVRRIASGVATERDSGAPASALRRTILAAALSLAPVASIAQPVRRVVYVPSPGWFAYRDSPALRERQRDYNVTLFTREGLVSGRDIALEDAFADSAEPEAVDRLARRVVASDPAIVLVTGDCVLDFLRHTARIPLVFYNMTEDPVRAGAVESHARPGRNVTGTTLTIPGEVPKGWELLKELAPRAKRLGVLLYAGYKSDPSTTTWLKTVAPGATGLGLALVEVEVPPGVTAKAFERIVRAARVDLLDVTGITDEPSTADIMQFLQQARLPALWLHADLVRRGGLLSSDFSRGEGFAEAVRMAVRVLRGENPATMPVRVPRDHVTTVNRGTARAMGLSIPDSVLLRAKTIID